jgi:TolA-binding protein
MAWEQPAVWALGVHVLERTERTAKAMKYFKRGLRYHLLRPEALQALADARSAALADGGTDEEQAFLREMAEKYPGTALAQQAAQALGA